MFKTRLQKFLCKFNYGIHGEILKFSMLYRSIVIRMVVNGERILLADIVSTGKLRHLNAVTRVLIGNFPQILKRDPINWLAKALGKNVERAAYSVVYV